MAVVFDNSADRLLRTTSLPLTDRTAAPTYTVMFWARFTNLASWSQMFSLNDNVAFSASDWIGKSGGDNWLTLGVDGSNSTAYTVLSVDTWYHVCVVRTATTSAVIYLNGVLNVTNTTSVNGTTLTRMEFGAYTTGNYDPFNGYISRIKCWTAALSEAEVLNEMRTIRPQRFANLYGYWPTWIGAGRVTDYSGLAKDFTAGGTLSDADDPPVSYGSGIYVLQKPAAAATATPPRPIMINQAVHRAATW